MGFAWIMSTKHKTPRKDSLNGLNVKTQYETSKISGKSTLTIKDIHTKGVRDLIPITGEALQYAKFDELKKRNELESRNKS